MDITRGDFAETHFHIFPLKFLCNEGYFRKNVLAQWDLDRVLAKKKAKPHGIVPLTEREKEADREIE